MVHGPLLFGEELSDGRSVAEEQGSRREQEVRVRGEVDLVDTAIYHLLEKWSVELWGFIECLLVVFL